MIAPRTSVSTPELLLFEISSSMGTQKLTTDSSGTSWRTSPGAAERGRQTVGKRLTLRKSKSPSTAILRRRLAGVNRSHGLHLAADAWITRNALREVCVSRQAHWGCSQSRYNCSEFENKPVGSHRPKHIPRLSESRTRAIRNPLGATAKDYLAVQHSRNSVVRRAG